MPVLSNPNPSSNPIPTPQTGPQNPVPVPNAYPRETDRQASTPPASTPQAPRQGNRQRWPWLVGAVLLVGAIAVGAAVLADDEPAMDETASAPLSAVTVETRDLIEFSDLDGRMVYADVELIATSAYGFATSVVESGEIVERGGVLYEVDAVPVQVFFGDVPLYRPLVEGSVGEDVGVLEENLASLGFHTFEDDNGDSVDTGFVVDGVFDAATTEAVLRWQEDSGLAPTGSLPEGAAVVVGGSALVTSVEIDVGSRVGPGVPALQLITTNTTSSQHTEHGGEIETFVSTGQQLVSGDVVYAVDDLPVSAIVTDETFDRDLREGIEPGTDIEVLETMLVSLGYDADGDLDVDDEFDENTTEAVKEWEEDLQDAFDDVVIDGVVLLNEIVDFPPGTTVGSLASLEDGLTPSGSVLWTSSSGTSARIVETSIAVSDQDRLAKGDVVDIEFPDGEVIEGTVTDVATSSRRDPVDPDADPTIDIEISLPTVPASAADLSEVDVEVKLIDQLASGVTVVPVSALLAIGDGGYAVEAITTTGTTFIEVDPGMFSDGWVEVVGVEPDTQVVVPS